MKSEHKKNFEPIKKGGIFKASVQSNHKTDPLTNFHKNEISKSEIGSNFGGKL